MLIDSWEIISGKATYYVMLYSDEIIVGHHYGSGHTDNAGVCSVKKFLEGRFQSLIIERFGEKVLNEIISLIKLKPRRGRD